jgi:predicted amidohydrolase YtcJ
LASGEEPLLITNVRVPGGARAIVVEGARIAYIGSEEGAKASRPRSARELDLRRGFAYPGLEDAHVHLTSLAREALDLRGCRSLAQLLEMVRDYCSSSRAEWVIGRGWSEELLREGRPPSREELDSASDGKPVVLYRICGHVAVLNSTALRRCGLEGGARQTDPERGLVKERDLMHVTKALPPPGREELRGAIERACRLCAAKGLTGAHVIVGEEGDELGAYFAGREAPKLRLRLWAREPQLNRLEEYRSRGNELLRVEGIKLFLDGSLGARTAALSEDYSDDPGNRGVLYYSGTELVELVARASARRWRIAMHAIGDVAVGMALDAIEGAGVDGELRPRIEHASLCTDGQLERMAKLGVCPVVQPHFVVSDWWAPKRLGPRTRLLYRFADMVRMGLRPAGSSDAPVEPVDPLTGLRVLLSGEGSSLEPQQALDFYTCNAARAANDEGWRGSLAVGYAADLTVYDRPLTLETLQGARLLATIVAGRPVYVPAAGGGFG